MGVGGFGPSNLPMALGSPGMSSGRSWLPAARSVPSDELQDVPRCPAPRRVDGVREAQAQR